MNLLTAKFSNLFGGDFLAFVKCKLAFEISCIGSDLSSLCIDSKIILRIIFLMVDIHDR